MSRTPVREALRRLAAEGLVRHEPNRGVQVEDWGVEDLDEIFSLRSQLEPWGCGLAATTGRADLDVLAELAERMDEEARRDPPDLDAITELNNRFHRTVLEASGNGRLVAMVSAVVEVPLVWRTFSHYSGEAMQRSLAHHHEIVHALRAGDAAWAESVMRSHVRAAWASLREEHGEAPSCAPRLAACPSPSRRDCCPSGPWVTTGRAGSTGCHGWPETCSRSGTSSPLRPSCTASAPWSCRSATPTACLPPSRSASTATTSRCTRAWPCSTGADAAPYASCGPTRVDAPCCWRGCPARTSPTPGTSRRARSSAVSTGGCTCRPCRSWRTVASYVERWLDELADLGRDIPIPRRYVEQALAIGRDLLAGDGTRPVVVHGDLHYANVLADDAGEWLAIDPKPMAGDPHYEPAPMLWNRMDELSWPRSGRHRARGPAPPVPRAGRRGRSRRGTRPRLGRRADGPQRRLDRPGRTAATTGA